MRLGRITLARSRSHTSGVARVDHDLAALTRATLKRRLRHCRTVADALRADPTDDEHVHQLRVATRRADAALRLFAPVLPRKTVRRLRKRLRSVRRAAGNVRNLDVLLLRLDPDDRSTVPAGHRKVIRKLRRRRQREVRRLLQLLPRLLNTRYRRLSRKVVRNLQDRLRNGHHVLTRQLLLPLINSFTEAASRDLADIDNLHRFRISGKRVRYALEILKGQIDKRCDSTAIGALKQLQEAVGTINDHHTAIGLLESIRPRCRTQPVREALDCLIAEEHRLLADRHATFLEWWQTAGPDCRNAIRNCAEVAAT